MGHIRVLKRQKNPLHVHAVNVFNGKICKQTRTTNGHLKQQNFTFGASEKVHKSVSIFHYLSLS